jgi:hypothetical protein
MPAPAFKTFFDGHDTLFYYKKAANHRENYGFKPILEGCLALISQENIPTFFCVLVELALSDGLLAEEEKNLLAEIQKGIRLEEELAKQIISVMIIRSKYGKRLG